MEPNAPTAGQDMATLRRRRAELIASMSTLELALAAGGPANTWAEGVRAALAELAADYRQRIDLDESPDGMANTVLARAPRLSHAVAGIIDERVELLALIDNLRTALSRPEATVDIDRVRDQGSALLGRLLRDRQRGSDLLHEADRADIGGES
jgi:hypothetical protein